MPEDRRFCPNCGSENVEPYTENRAEIAISGGNPNKWQCRECGMVGLMPEKDGGEQEDIDFEESENVEKMDTGFGRGYLKYLVYIALPLTLAWILYLTLI